MQHTRFHYQTLADVQDELQTLHLTLPLSDNVDILKQSLTIEGRTIPNRIAIQPMEGCDGTADGAPGELTWRRYLRFAESGAGLIWLEAVAIVNEGRANPRQLHINEGNLDSFKKLLDEIRETSIKRNGFAPLIIMQATHSGRYAKPHGVPEPMIAYNNPIFEKDHPIDPSRIVTDEYLDMLAEKYGEAAILAGKAGFDGIDVKCCHRYLLSELCSAYLREGKYGGSLENRTRLLREGIRNAKEASTLIVTSRLNLYDGFPYPYGFGVQQEYGDTVVPMGMGEAKGDITPDLTEAKWLVGQLMEEGVELLDLTIGNPYFNPHVNRPFDQGGYIPPEHPLEGVARMMNCIGDVAKAYPELKIISSGHSYLRQFSGNLAAGAVETGVTSIAGFGREAFAYPDFVHDLLEHGSMDPKKCCITCGKCTELMRAGSVAGCVIRDTEVYLPLYQRDVLKKG